MNLRGGVAKPPPLRRGFGGGLKNAKTIENSQTDTSELEQEIDTAVYALYALTPTEIALIKGKKRNKNANLVVIARRGTRRSNPLLTFGAFLGYKICKIDKFALALFQKSVDLSLRAYEVGEESINLRHFSINSWIILLCCAQNDKYGILPKINSFLKKSLCILKRTVCVVGCFEFATQILAMTAW